MYLGLQVMYPLFFYVMKLRLLSVQEHFLQHITLVEMLMKLEFS